MLTFVPSADFSFSVLQKASTKVIGIIARVRVSFTIVAVSKVLLPCIPSQAVAAAVTDEVSLTAVPANNPNPSLDNPSMEPSVGKINAAMILNKNINEKRIKEGKQGERIRLIVNLVDKLGMSFEEACRFMEIPQEKIEEYRKKIEES